MPELNLSMEILSVMAYPNDDKARKKLLANISSKASGDAKLDKGLRGGLGEIFSKMGGIPTLHDSPEYIEIIKQYNLSVYRGHLAGAVLHYIWRIEVSSASSGASVNKAKFLVVELFKEIKNEITAWKDYPFNEKYISQAWSDFKPVAHLWAAFLQWDMWGRPEDLAPYRPLGVNGFISLSEKFRTFGITHFPRAKNAATLSSEKTWAPPKEFKPIALQNEILPPPLSPEDLEVLEEYRAPKTL